MRSKENPEPEPEPDDVIAETQHFVSATTLMAGTPFQTFSKLKRIIAERWPGKRFRIQSMNSFPAGNGYTINALIEEIQ